MAMAKGLEADDKDRLSLLPDDILSGHILSLLPMKEAVRTSILARRWRHLWLYVPSLDFDASEEVVRVRRSRTRQERDEALSNYVEWVDGVIRAYRGWGSSAPIRHFRVRFCLDAGFSLKIESWLMFSLAKVLELESTTKAPPRGSLCEFPSISPGQYPALRHLKSLILGGLAITWDSLNHLLQGSEFLERLELRNLESSGHVNVAGPISRLKSIGIFGCYGFESIIISAPTPDLVSFIYPSEVTEVYLEHAPKLAEIFIGRSRRYLISHPLFRYMSQLETLHLTFSCWEKLSCCFPDLRRLKHLHLEVLGFELTCSSNLTSSRVRGLASLINAAPCVEHLTLEVDYLNYMLKMRDEFADLDLQHLRVIEIVGFRGRRLQCDLALCLIKAAASSLEKLIIDLRCTGEYISRKEIDRRTSPAKELIENEALSKVDLVFTGYKELRYDQ